MFVSVSRRRALVGGIAALSVLFIRPAVAHDADCPLCKLPVPQDTATQDNEVALRYGRKRIEYRCVGCALTEAQTQYTGDLTILAPSEVKGRPVAIARKDGKWSTAPAGAVFVGVNAGHKVCPTTYRAFTTRAAFDAWVTKHSDLLKGAKPLTTVEQLVAASAAHAGSKGK